MRSIMPRPPCRHPPRLRCGRHRTRGVIGLLPVFTSRRRRAPDPAGRLLFGQLVMFTGIAMLFPVVALYVRHRGGSALDAALFIAGPMLANTLVQVPAGRLADRVGRRPVLIGTRLGYAAI